MGGGGGISDFLNSFGKLGPIEKFQNPRTTSTGRKVKFTPKYIIVGGQGRVSEFLLRVQCNSFGN